MQWIQEQMDALKSPVIQMFIRPLSRPVLILADFRESQDILLRRKEWDRSDMLAELLKGLLPGHHLAERTNSVWKFHRRLLQDLMSPPFLRNVAAPAVYHTASLLINLWEIKARAAGARPFSALDDIFIAALDAVHAFAFGQGFEHSATRSKLETLERLNPRAIEDLLRGDATKTDEGVVEFPEPKLDDVISVTLSLTAAVEKLQGSPFMRLTWKLMELTPSMRRVRKIKDACILGELERAVDHLLDQRVKSPGDESPPAVRSAVDHLVRREKQLAEKENRAPQYFSQTMTTETFGFIIGGHESTSTTLSWGLKAMTDNQSSQAKLRSILQASFNSAKSDGRNPTVEEITDTDIPYLDAVLEEILRYNGASPALERQAMTNTQVLGHHVPKGTILLMLTQAQSLKFPAFDIDESRRSQSSKLQGQYPMKWDPQNVNEFKPERWLVPTEDSPSSETKKRFYPNAGPILAFGLGLRGCYGRKLAYLELRILITLIVWNFELLPVPKGLSTDKANMGVTSKPRDCYVSLRKVNLEAN